MNFDSSTAEQENGKWDQQREGVYRLTETADSRGTTVFNFTPGFKFLMGFTAQLIHRERMH